MSGGNMKRHDEANPRDRRSNVASAGFIDQYFDALQDAIVRGDEPVEVTPEIRAFTGAVRGMIADGRDGLPAVHRLAAQFGHADDNVREPALDPEPTGPENPKLPGEMLLQALDRILECSDQVGAETGAAVPGTMTDDEVRTAARDIWHPGVREPGANA